MAHLAPVLTTRAWLAHLDLSGHTVDHAALCRLFPALEMREGRTGQLLLYLGLHHNPLGVEGAAALAKYIRRAASTPEVTWRRDDVRTEGARVMEAVQAAFPLLHQPCDLEALL